MNKVTLQIPIELSLRDAATEVAKDLGFSSLQEAVRVYLKQLSHRRVRVSVVREPEVEYLTLAQEKVLAKKSAQIKKEIAAGNYIKSSDIKEIMDYLND